MKYVKGDLIRAALDGKFDVIGHGCNCFINFGAGIAKAIKLNFPEAYKADVRNGGHGDKKKLGTVSKAEIGSLIVLNCYTQHSYGRGINVDYNAIRSCMKEIKVLYSGKRIGLPKIGCGLAKGDWKVVSQIIEEELNGEDVTIMYL